MPSKLLLTPLCAALAALIAACSDPAPRSPVWEPAFDATNVGSLSGVWGSAPDDVFVVGGDENGGLIYHFDGGAWRAMSLPEDTPLLVWVFGFGSDDVIAVGLDGAVVRYDGSDWRAVESGLDYDLWGVFGFAPDDVWIVGGAPLGRSDRDADALLVHFDGDVFERVVLDETQNPNAAAALFKVWGIDGRLIAVGEDGWVLEHDPAGWSRVSAGAEADQDFVSLWGTSRDDIVIVGGRSNARIAEASDGSFTTVAPSGLGGMNAVFMDDASEAIIGGVNGFAGRFDRASGTVVREDAPGGPDAVHAIWGDGNGRWYGVGGSFVAPHRGLAWVRTMQ